MTPFDYVQSLCYASMLFSFIASLYQYRILDKALKVIPILLGSTFIAECTAFVYAKFYHNNMPVYGIFSLIEFSLISCYFNYSIDVFHRHHIGFMIAVLGIIVGIANIIYLQPLTQLNNYYLFFEGIFIISMALFSFIRLMMLQDAAPMYWNPHFWIATIFIFFWAITFLNWGIYEYMIVKYKSSMGAIAYLINIVNIITYGSIGIVFLLLPKMQRHS